MQDSGFDSRRELMKNYMTILSANFLGTAAAIGAMRLVTFWVTGDVH